MEFRHRDKLRVTDAAEILGVARSTAHRILSTLHYRGFVVQEVDGRGYVAGRLLYEIGLAAVDTLDMHRTARPYLEDLSHELDESIHLVVLEGNGIRFLESVEARHRHRVGARTGMLLPAHVTAGGKAMLAQMGEEYVRALYPRVMTALTEHSITDIDRLIADLQSCTARGYAINHNESEEGVKAIAISFGSLGGRGTPAAIVVAAPEQRMPTERVPAVVRRLQRFAVGMAARIASAHG